MLTTGKRPEVPWRVFGDMTAKGEQDRAAAAAPCREALKQALFGLGGVNSVGAAEGWPCLCRRDGPACAVSASGNLAGLKWGMNLFLCLRHFCLFKSMWQNQFLTSFYQLWLFPSTHMCSPVLVSQMAPDGSCSFFCSQGSTFSPRSVLL